MSDATRTDSHAADPWWSDPAPAPIADAFVAAAPSSRRAIKTGRARRSRTGIGWFALGVIVAPIDWMRRAMRKSPLLRRIAIRTLVLGIVLVLLASSVGVILINNIVIGRTAELGELDQQRRELRKENALLSAEAARLSQPSIVFNRASNELGMVRTPELPQFIYLDPGSRTLTPLQRRWAMTRDARIRAAAERANGVQVGKLPVEATDPPAPAAASASSSTTEATP